MSLIDLILQESLILLVFGMALFLLLSAVSLVLMARWRQARVRRARRQAAQQTQLHLDLAKLAEVEAAALAAADADNTDDGADNADNTENAEEAVAAAAEATETSSQAQSDKPASAMQDLLTSIFADDQKADRYAVLLKDTEQIEIDDLLNLTQRVADRLQPVAGPAMREPSS